MRSRRPSPAMLVALLALFVALGGSSYAALQIPRGSVGTKQLKNGAVTSPKVKNNSLLVRDFKASQRSQLRGPQGAQGPQGPQGPQGQVGPASGAAGGALAGSYPNPMLAPHVRGPAVAGARITVEGEVLDWFNRRGGEPTVAAGSDEGEYFLTFPGSSFEPFNSIPVATLFGDAGEIQAISNGPAVVVQTYNSAGGQPFTGVGFTLVVFDASATG
jgi:hypothetical protein